MFINLGRITIYLEIISTTLRLNSNATTNEINTSQPSFGSPSDSCVRGTGYSIRHGEVNAGLKHHSIPP